MQARPVAMDHYAGSAIMNTGVKMNEREKLMRQYRGCMLMWIGAITMFMAAFAFFSTGR